MSRRRAAARLGRLGSVLATGLAASLLTAPFAVASGAVASGAVASGAAQAGSSRSPRVVTVQDPRIVESSGLALSRPHSQLAWTVNDSGAAIVYGLSTRTGRTQVALTLAGVDLRDAEALAAGQDAQRRPWLVVADIGDNRAVRDSVVLRFLREPAQVRSDRVPVTSLRLRYPDGPQDAETLIWQPDGRLLVVTKALLTARVYQVPADAVATVLAGRSVSTPVLAEPVGRVQHSLVTDGTALPDGQVVLRGYRSATVYRWDDGALTSTARLDLPSQPQGETIAAEPDAGTLLVGSEGVRQPIWRVRLADAGQLSAGALPVSPGPAADVSPPAPGAVTDPAGGTASADPGAAGDLTSHPPDVVAGRALRPSPVTTAEQHRTPWAGVLLALVAGGVLGLGAIRGARRHGRRTP